MEDEIKTNLDTVYLPSEEMVVREIQGEFVIIPLKDGMADLEDELFELTETAKAMGDKLNTGKRFWGHPLKGTCQEKKEFLP